MDVMKRAVYFAIPPSLRTPTILSRVQQLSRLHCRLSSAHALEGERVKVCPPFTRGQVFETCNFFLFALLLFAIRYFFFFFFFFFIRLFYIFTFLWNYVIFYLLYNDINIEIHTEYYKKIITQLESFCIIQTVYI